MINFKTIKRSEIKSFKKYRDSFNTMGCDVNMLNAYIWRNRFVLKYEIYNATLIRAYFNDDGILWGYCMPTGRDIAGALEQIMLDAQERKISPMFVILTEGQRALLETIYPSKFEYIRTPDEQDYLYLTKDLVMLAGKKYHSKRNHIARFYRTYDDTRFETLDSSNASDALEVVKLWYKENNLNFATYGEYEVIKEAIEMREEFDMQGAVLYVDQKPVAMTLGSEISDKVFDIYFEKALREYDGVYAVINNEFAKTLTKYEYINREEDMGIEGLRKAKMSYNPCIILDRYNAVLKNGE